MSNSEKNNYIKIKNKYNQHGGKIDELTDNNFLNELFSEESYDDMIGGNGNFLNKLFSEESYDDMIGGNDDFLNNLFSEDNNNDMIGGNVSDNFLNNLFDDIGDNTMVGGNEVSEGNFFNDLFTESELNSFNDEQNGGGWFDSWFGINEKKNDTPKQNFNIEKLSNSIKKDITKVSDVFKQNTKHSPKSPKSPKKEIINSDIKSDMVGGMISDSEFLNRLFD